MTSKLFQDLPLTRRELKRFPPLGVKIKEFSEKPSTACQDFEYSPACRYFTHEDGKLTGRTTTRSTKYTNARPKASSTHLTSLSDVGILWELQERVDSFNIRYEGILQGARNFSSFLDLFELCKMVSSDIVKTVKIYYPDLSQIFSLFIETVFRFIREIIEMQEDIQLKNRVNLEEMFEKQRKLSEHCSNLQSEIENMKKIRKFEEGEIEAELKKIFQDTSEEVSLFKERVQQMRDLRPEGTSSLLKDVYRDMNKERKIPDEPIADFSDMDPEVVIQGIKGNYQVIISKTIKNVKKTLNPTGKKSIASVQTEGNYIDPKSVEDLNKIIEKTNAQYNSLSFQYERSKIDIKNLQENANKAEIERSNLRVELIGTKKDLENKSKEVTSIKLELETKKTEVVILTRINNDKEKEIENLKLKLKIQEKSKKDPEHQEVGKILEEVEQNNRKSKRLEIIEETKEKTTSLNAVTRSGLTIREELEKEYNFQLRRNSMRPELEGLKTSTRGRLEVLTPTNPSNLSPPEESHSPTQSTDTKPKLFHQTEAISLSVPKKTKKSKKLKNKLIQESSNFSVKVKKPEFSTTEKLKKPKISTGFSVIQEREESLESPLSPLSPQKSRSQSRTRSMNTENVKEESQEVKSVSKQDKACGLDIRAEVSIGIQVGEEEEKGSHFSDFKMRGVNPNNLYGLRGDVFYQGAQFVPQTKIPELQLPFKPAYF
jgi:hypothetical protein